MNLSRKKELAARALGIGKNRIIFADSRKNEIKEAITKQDIRDLKNDGAIAIREIKGRRKKFGGKKRNPGSIRKKVNKRKKEYINAARKQRKYALGMKNEGKIGRKEHKEIRKKIRNRFFRSKSHLKEVIK